MNKQLNAQLNGLLTATGLVGQKESLVLSATKGRSQSRKDLSDFEARGLINFLQQEKNKMPDAANKMRRKIISLAYEMHWAKAGDWKAAVKSIDTFCLSPKGLFKKELQKHSYAELVQVVTQFEMMYKKYLNKF